MAKKFQFGDTNIDVPDFNFQGTKKLLFAVIVLVLGSSSFYTVDANENGVVLRLGQYSHTSMPGLHFMIPFVDSVEKVKVDYQFKQEYGYKTLKSGVKTTYSKRDYSFQSWMLTGDLNIAKVQWTVQYKIKDAKDFLFNVRDVENTISNVSEASMRLMIGDRSFSEVIQSERVAIASKAREYMQEVLDGYGAGISIQMVQLQGVTPPEPVADSFNEVNRAKQEQETMINDARKAFNKEIYRAEGEALKLIKEAEGYAIERVNNAKGDVALFSSILKEYIKAPKITKDRYYIETMEKVLSRIEDKVVVDSKLESILPLLNLDKGGKK